jgi:hypothetical protein
MKLIRPSLFPLLLAAIVLLAVSSSLADASPQARGLRLAWWTVDGGGGTSKDGAYILSGTAGQPDAGLLLDATYTLVGGAWGRAGDWVYRIYLPAILRAFP